jgi:hypothetical protein
VGVAVAPFVSAANWGLGASLRMPAKGPPQSCAYDLRGSTARRSRLADGRLVTYWWAWKGGPLLRGEPGSPVFIASNNEAIARKITPPAGLLFSVLQRYQASEDFRDLADRTRSDYTAKIKLIEKAFGDFPGRPPVWMIVPYRLSTSFRPGRATALPVPVKCRSKTLPLLVRHAKSPGSRLPYSRSDG